MGNFYGTTQGAPSAPLESGPALSQRQQRLRDVTRQFRQQLSNQYLQAYARRAQEQRAADIAKAREQDRQQLWQWRKQQEERLAGKQALDSAKLDWKKQYDEGRLDIAREQNRIRDMVAKGQISHYEAEQSDHRGVLCRPRHALFRKDRQELRRLERTEGAGHDENHDEG